MFSLKSRHPRSKVAFPHLPCAQESLGSYHADSDSVGLGGHRECAGPQDVLGGEFLSQTLPGLAHVWDCLEGFKTHSFPPTSKMLIHRTTALLSQTRAHWGPEGICDLHKVTQREPRLQGPRLRYVRLNVSWYHLWKGARKSVLPGGLIVRCTFLPGGTMAKAVSPGWKHCPPKNSSFVLCTQLFINATSGWQEEEEERGREGSVWGCGDTCFWKRPGVFAEVGGIAGGFS